MRTQQSLQPRIENEFAKCGGPNQTKFEDSEVKIAKKEDGRKLIRAH